MKTKNDLFTFQVEVAVADDLFKISLLERFYFYADADADAEGKFSRKFLICKLTKESRLLIQMVGSIENRIKKWGSGVWKKLVVQTTPKAPYFNNDD